MYVYIYIYIHILCVLYCIALKYIVLSHCIIIGATFMYVRSLPGWLETRLARITLNYINIA